MRKWTTNSSVSEQGITTNNIASDWKFEERESYRCRQRIENENSRGLNKLSPTE